MMEVRAVLNQRWGTLISGRLPPGNGRLTHCFVGMMGDPWFGYLKKEGVQVREVLDSEQKTVHYDESSHKAAKVDEFLQRGKAES
jgi:hypothetical protein